MKLFGITGGIGMGKSTAGNLLLEAGYPLIDTDEIARQIVQPGCPALAEIRGVFGPKVISHSGELLRQDLAKVVFNDPVARQKLESILHPRIRNVWQQAVEEWRNQRHSVGFVVIPLLFETKAEIFFDAVVCVACSRDSQEERLLARGWNREQILARLSAQWPVEQKMAASDYVVWTETTLEMHQAQWKVLLHSF